MPKLFDIWSPKTSGLQSLLRGLLSTLIAVVQKEQRLSLQFSGSEASLQSGERFGYIQLLNRSLYTEQHKRYPALSAAALDAVLTQEYAGQSVLHQVGPSQNNQIEVTSYVLNSTISAELRSGFWLPESLLFSQFAPGQVLEVDNGVHSYFCCCWNGMHSSALKTAICPDISRFKMIRGLPDDLPVLRVTQQDYTTNLLKALLQLPAATWPRFWRLQSRQFNLNWRAVLLTAVIGWASYLTLVSGWLHWRGLHLAGQSEALGTKINDHLALQKQLESRGALQQELISGYDRAVYPQQISLLLAELVQANIVVERVQLKDGSVELSARAKKAADALTLLQAKPYIANASYGTATRRIGDFEQFTVNVRFNNAGAAHD